MVPGDLGNFVVRIPTTASGRSARYVELAITTAGRTLVSWAPTSMPTKYRQASIPVLRFLGVQATQRCGPEIVQVLI